MAKKTQAKKSRLKGDPFATPPDRTEQAEAAASGQESASLAQEQAVPPIKRERIIFIKYKKEDGQIIAIQEIRPDRNEVVQRPWSSIPKDMEAKKLDLPTELADKSIVDMHQNYKVSTVDEKPTLIPKT